MQTTISTNDYFYSALGVKKSLLDTNDNSEFVDGECAAEAFSILNTICPDEQLQQYLKRLSVIFNVEGKRWWEKGLFSRTRCLFLVQNVEDKLHIRPEVATEELY